MSSYRPAHRLAAQMLLTDPGLLHHDLVATLTLADDRVQHVSDGWIRSHQTVAAIIAAWEMTHPHESAVCED